MEEYFDEIDNEEKKIILKRCENMLKYKKQHYFDVHQFLNLIDHYYDDSNISDANKLLDIGLQQHPDSAELKLKNVKFLVDGGKIKEALEELKLIEKIDENNYEIYVLKGVCLSSLGDNTEAMKYFSKAISLEKEKEDKSDVLHIIAQHFINLNNYDFALKYLIKSYSIDRSNTPVLHDIAYCYDHLFELDKSVKFYKKFIEEEPYSDGAWFNLGNVYNKLERYNEAIEAFDYSLAINEDNSTALFNKANTFANWEKFDKAIECYQEYLKYDKNNVIALYYIGECHEKAGNYNDALHYYHKVLKADKNFSDAWYGIGITKFYQNKFEESLRYVEKAIELDNENSEYWFTYGNIHRELELDAKAELQGFKRAIELNPYDEEFWLYYSLSVRNYVDVEKALEILEESREYVDDSAEILFILAAYYYSTNDVESSLEYFDKAKKIDADKALLFFGNCEVSDSDKGLFSKQ